MSARSLPFNVSEELTKLRHEKKNGQMRKLPANATIQLRPIIHAPIPSQYVGAKVPKVVYVSTKTPFISAVKRVKKLLTHVEKRATQYVKLIRKDHQQGLQELAEASEQLGKSKEEVLVKASGRAIEKALKVGEWFSNKEKDMSCKVEVRSGSVSVVDDIVEVEVESDGEAEESVEHEEHEEPPEDEDTTTELEGGDTTMELLGDTTKATVDVPLNGKSQEDKGNTGISSGMSNEKKKRRRGKRKRQTYDPDDLPESRIRWVKTVEVAITLKA